MRRIHSRVHFIHGYRNRNIKIDEKISPVRDTVNTQDAIESKLLESSLTLPFEVDINN